MENEIDIHDIDIAATNFNLVMKDGKQYLRHTLPDGRYLDVDTSYLVDESEETLLEREMDRYFETMTVLQYENIFEETFHAIARHFYAFGKANARRYAGTPVEPAAAEGITW